MQTTKIALIGCGAVGTSFIYSAMNQGLGQKYVLIDVVKETALGNSLDFSDAQAGMERPFTEIVAGDYADLKDIDILVITAGRPQKPNETRLEMIADNAKIMKNIALNVKNSGFSGITIIASNPVDVMTTVYQKITGFDIHRVIGSGTILDTFRLKHFLAHKLSLDPTAIAGFVMAEHGDSSFVPWSCMTIANKTIAEHLEEKNLSKSDLPTIEKAIIQRAYEIINLKRATFYGIGAALALLVKNVIYNLNQVVAISAYLEGQYENSGFYLGVPAIVGGNGWKEIVQLPITKEEQTKFNNSCAIIKESLKTALAAIA